MWGWIKKVGRAVVRGDRVVVRGVREIVSGASWVIHRVLGIPELIASLAGIRISKKFRLKVLILPDSSGTPLATTEAVEEVVDEAKRVFHRNRMKVRLIPPADEETIVSHFSGSVPDYVRRPECGPAGWAERYKRIGRWYARHSAPYAGQGTATVFVVNDVHEGPDDKYGCFLGLVDYGYIDTSALRPPATPVPIEPVVEFAPAGVGAGGTVTGEWADETAPGSVAAAARAVRSGRNRRWHTNWDTLAICCIAAKGGHPATSCTLIRTR